MRIAMGCDHGGIVLKPAIVAELQKRGVEIVDKGCFDGESVDYPDYALKVAESVASGECDKGVLMCGTGIGISIAANKVKGIRAAVCHDEFTAQMIAEHNCANIIALGGRIMSPETAAKLVGIWLDTPFGGGRHKNRIDKISAIEDKYFK